MWVNSAYATLCVQQTANNSLPLSNSGTHKPSTTALECFQHRCQLWQWTSTTTQCGGTSSSATRKDAQPAHDWHVPAAISTCRHRLLFTGATAQQLAGGALLLQRQERKSGRAHQAGGSQTEDLFAATRSVDRRWVHKNYSLYINLTLWVLLLPYRNRTHLDWCHVRLQQQVLAMERRS